MQKECVRGSMDLNTYLNHAEDDARIHADAEDANLDDIDVDDIPPRPCVFLHLSICGDPPHVVVTFNVMGVAALAEEAAAAKVAEAAAEAEAAEEAAAAKAAEEAAKAAEEAAANKAAEEAAAKAAAQVAALAAEEAAAAKVAEAAAAAKAAEEAAAAKTNKPSWTAALEPPAPEGDIAHVLGPRGELHDFKAQAGQLYKYESRLTGYSVSKEEEWAKDSPGYYTLQTSGNRTQLHDKAAGGPRFGIPIQEFHWKDEKAGGAQVVGRVPPDDESPFEVSVCPLRTVLTCSQPDLRAFLVIGV